MSIERARNLLMDLGLSEIDIQIYVFLASNGPHKVKEITKQVRVGKAQIYRSLNKMLKKKVLSKTKDNPGVFSSVPFEQVVILLAESKEEEAQSLQDSREQLLSKWHKTVKE